MKKILLLITLFFALGTLLVACGEGSNAPVSSEDNVENSLDKEASAQEDEPNQEEKDGAVEVNKGLFNVEITFPASFFEEEDIDQVIANAKEEGVGEVTVRDDGSVTYKMSKSLHGVMMKEAEESIIESVEEMKMGGDFQSIKDITYNKSFNEFTLIVDKEAYENSFDGFAVLGIGMMGLYYQVFDGVNPDDNKVKVNVEDVATGEVFNVITYPDDMAD